MEQGKKGGKRGPEKEFTERVPIYENPEGLDLLEQLAQRRGLSRAALVRQLIREEAQRIGVQPG